MIDVIAPAGPYRAAVAELPLSARPAASAAGSIVVVRGERNWMDAVRAAADDGALAVVVADPVTAPPEEVRRLIEAARIPVIVERPLLRADVAEDARRSRDGAPVHVVVLDGAASAARLGVIARDAVGWARTLSGHALTLVSADRGLALLDAAGVGVTVSVVATRRPGGGWLRAQALGPVVTDVEVEGREARVSSATPAGRVIRPTRFESSERLALRRAIEAVAAPDRPTDLADLLVDVLLAEHLVRPRP